MCRCACLRDKRAPWLEGGGSSAKAAVVGTEPYSVVCRLGGSVRDNLVLHSVIIEVVVQGAQDEGEDGCGDAGGRSLAEDEHHEGQRGQDGDQEGKDVDVDDRHGARWDKDLRRHLVLVPRLHLVRTAQGCKLGKALQPPPLGEREAVEYAADVPHRVKHAQEVPARVVEAHEEFPDLFQLHSRGDPLLLGSANVLELDFGSENEPRAQNDGEEAVQRPGESLAQ
mmetsp:Transcript_12600/g.31873  ORF Transcript_12600/g.31873 Transcript_12600/m.31873 type:complete len:225 (-) Transcript_12600:1100-1774(-)